MEEEIKNIEEKKEEPKKEDKKPIILPEWSIDVPLEINRGEK